MSDVSPRFTAKDDPDHMAGNTIVGRDDTIRTTWISTNGAHLVASKFVSSIESLFTPCRPAAIAWLVITIIVDAFKRQFWVWPISHVREKISEDMPAFAYFDAATAVVFEATVAWVVAPLKHGVPDKIFRSLRHTDRLAWEVEDHNLV